MILLMAAGASSRMRGRDKLMEPVAGEPLLARQAKAALATGEAVIVALPAATGPRDEALHGLNITKVHVAEAQLGMGHSLAAGAQAAITAGAEWLLVLNADLPGIGMAELQTALAARAMAPQRIHIGTDAKGALGHPVVFPRALLPELASLTGDTGAKALVRREGFLTVPLPGDAATRDLDTPEDWALWRQETGL